jgi:hypothetical protein
MTCKTQHSVPDGGSPSRLPFPLVFDLILNQNLSLSQSESQSLCFEGALKTLRLR